MISIKTPKELQIMREGGRILAKIMKELTKRVKTGITTKELGRVAETLILKYGGKCSFKGYQGYPACLCTSLNEEIVHCVPSDRVLKDGDIISLDLGFFYKGFHTDMAVSLLVPTAQVTTKSAYADFVVTNVEKIRLIRVTKKALKIALKKVRPGNHFGDIGNTIQRYVESQGYNVVRDLCGHGIGREVHEDPQIFNYGKRRTGPELAEGMVFCIEPMITIGDWKIKKSKDGFGYQTPNDSLSCHFEHTVAVTKDGYEVLTEN